MGDKELTQERLFVCDGLRLCRFNWLGDGEAPGPFIRARCVCRNHRQHLEEEGMERLVFSIEVLTAETRILAFSELLSMELLWILH